MIVNYQSSVRFRVQNLGSHLLSHRGPTTHTHMQFESILQLKLGRNVVTVLNIGTERFSQIV